MTTERSLGCFRNPFLAYSSASGHSNSPVKQPLHLMKNVLVPSNSGMSSSSSPDLFRASTSSDPLVRIMRCAPRYPRVIKIQRPVSTKCGAGSTTSASDHTEDFVVCHSKASNTSASSLNVCSSSFSSSTNELPKPSLILYLESKEHLPRDKGKDTKVGSLLFFVILKKRFFPKCLWRKITKSPYSSF